MLNWADFARNKSQTKQARPRTATRKGIIHPLTVPSYAKWIIRLGGFMLDSISNKVIPYRMNLIWLAKRWGMDIESFLQALVQLVNIDGLKVYTSYQGCAIYGIYGYSDYESPSRYGAKWYQETELEGWYGEKGASTTKALLEYSLNNRDEKDYATKLMQLDNTRYKAYLVDREFIPEPVEVDAIAEMLNYESNKVYCNYLYVDESMGRGNCVHIMPVICKGSGIDARYKTIKLTLDLENTFIYRDDLKHFEQSQGWFDHGINLEVENKEKTLDTRERNSYLAFVKSLCEYYGIDINGIKAKQLEIHKDEGKDFSISNRTALKILNQLK